MDIKETLAQIFNALNTIPVVEFQHCKTKVLCMSSISDIVNELNRLEQEVNEKDKGVKDGQV